MQNLSCSSPTSFRLAILLALAAAAPAALHAQSADALIDKLVEKGILSLDEAKVLREETDDSFKHAYQVRSGMPDWVNSLKLNGDFRGRYDGIFIDNESAVDRSRFRYRLRFGATAVMADNFEVGLRLTSGDPAPGAATFGGNPLSGNSTFSNNGSKKFLYVDLAYAKWTPLNGPDWSATSTIGKMMSPFVFQSTEVLDPDYTPEGFAQQVGFRFNDKHSLNWVGGGFLLREIDVSSHDPFMLGTQLRFNSAWSKKLTSSAGIGFFAITHPDFTSGLPPVTKDTLNNDQVPDLNKGNTRDGAGNLVAEFNPIYVDAAVTYNLESFPLYTGPFPITASGDYIYNPATSDQNRGFTLGVTFGKAGKKRTYEVSYRYIEMQADAWYEEVIEDDFGAYYEGNPPGSRAGYGAGTNLRGHIVKATYSPYDSFSIGVSLFLAKLIHEVPAVPSIDPTSDTARILVDVIWKF